MYGNTGTDLKKKKPLLSHLNTSDVTFGSSKNGELFRCRKKVIKKNTTTKTKAKNKTKKRLTQKR